MVHAADWLAVLVSKEPGLQLLDRFGLHPRQDVRVDAQRQAGRGVTQALLDQFDIGTILEQQCSVQVPERVERDAGKFRPLQDLTEIAALNIVDVKRFAARLAEDQVVVFVCLPEVALVFSLFLAQLEERLHEHLRQIERPARTLALWLLPDLLLAQTDERLSDLECRHDGVKVCPTQAK